MVCFIGVWGWGDQLGDVLTCRPTDRRNAQTNAHSPSPLASYTHLETRERDLVQLELLPGGQLALSWGEERLLGHLLLFLVVVDWIARLRQGFIVCVLKQSHTHTCSHTYIYVHIYIHVYSSYIPGTGPRGCAGGPHLRARRRQTAVPGGGRGAAGAVWCG